MSKFFYSVRENDTLPIIANKFVNDSNRWPELVQTNLSNYPTKLVNISGTILPVFTDLFIGQRLYLPNSWLGANGAREKIDNIKDYGYSYDIYRFDSNPRIVYHDMPFDYLLVEKIFGCKNINQFQPNPYRRGEDQRTCYGEPGMYTYYGYDKRLHELWGANLDKRVVRVSRGFGQEHPYYKLEMQAGDVVKIPAHWPDYKQCSGNNDFMDIDNLSKYAVPLTNGTDVDTNIKLYLNRRNSVNNRFWTANRNSTDFTALDVTDMLTRDRESRCECQGGDIDSCNCQRPDDRGIRNVFLGSSPESDGSVGSGEFKVIGIPNQALLIGLGQAANGDEIIATCTKETVADIKTKPDEYKRLLAEYGSDEALVNAIMVQCKEMNKDLIAQQDQNSNKESSKWPQVLLGIGIAGIIGTIIVVAGKEATQKAKYGY